ncbi:MAG: TetR family transcriptional regulator [Planctomycetes bacterium]|nr:TetR family transcriptional regulator [Planctomycetota bacterium]
MGKTTNHKRHRNAQLSKNRLLESAIEVFARLGPNAASVEEICRKADLNKRMAYHYFGSKAALYRQALAVVYDKFFQLEVSLGTMLLPAEQLLETLVSRYYQFLKDHPAFVRMISYENLNQGHTARQLNLRGQKAPVITAIQLALQKGQAEGRFRQDIDAKQLLVSIFSLCFFHFSNRYTMKQLVGTAATTSAAMNARVRHVVDLLLNGITHEQAPNRPPDKQLQP